MSIVLNLWRQPRTCFLCSALGGLAPHVKYSDLFGGVEEQSAVVKEYVERLKEREKVVANVEEDAQAGGEPQAAED